MKRDTKKYLYLDPVLDRQTTAAQKISALAKQLGVTENAICKMVLMSVFGDDEKSLNALLLLAGSPTTQLQQLIQTSQQGQEQEQQRTSIPIRKEEEEEDTTKGNSQQALKNVIQGYNWDN